jgi:hypothetical protein
VTPDQKIDLFLQRVPEVMKKYALVEMKSPHLIPRLEKTMKVIDQKIPAIGQMLDASNRSGARQTLDHALKAIELLNRLLDRAMS